MARFLFVIVFLIAAYALYSGYGYRYYLANVQDSAPADMIMGDKGADINITAYIDYESQSSRRLYVVLLNLLSSNPNVNVLFRPVATDSAMSEMATSIVLSAQKQGEFMGMHNAILNINSALSEDDLEASARSLGLSYTSLRADALNFDIAQDISKIQRETKLLGVDDVPYFFINHVRMPGNVVYTLPDLNRIIQDLQTGRR